MPLSTTQPPLRTVNNTNFLTAKYKLKYDDINHLSGFPLLNMSGQPVDYGKAVLAYSEGKYHQALSHLEKSIQISPNYLGHYGFKALIYGTNEVLKNPDSTFYYARKTFDAKPSIINSYVMLKRHYIAKKDTLGYLNLINKHLCYVCNFVLYFQGFFLNLQHNKHSLDELIFYLKEELL